MPHQIKFLRPYKSITSLPDIELPDIAVITGANGSGKSHFMKALASGYVSSSETSESRKHISLFDWNTIVPADNGAYSIAARTAKVDEAIERFNNAKLSVLTAMQQNLESNNVDNGVISTLDDLEYVCDQKILDSGADSSYTQAARLVQAWMPQYGSQFINSIGTESYGLKQRVKEIWSKDYRTLMFGKTDAVREQLLVAEELTLNIFSQAFAKIFVDYMHRWQTNYLSQATDSVYLDEKEFVRINQIPPWDFVNKILEESRLPFRINYPSKNNFLEAYEPKLIRQNNGAEMRFNDLSSGEKVLMSFALCVYNATGKNPIVFPKILLLDEVDAPLHPEMVGIMFKVIKNILVDDHKIKVVLTTHKPTTVALAPEHSIFQMVQDGPELRPITREKAVSILTVGVPTMAFTSDLRQQVFTEAETDAYCLSALYQIFKSEIPSDRSLVFMPSGRKTLKGDKDSGCGRVKDLVKKLRENGVSTVFGITDWDCRNRSNNFVFVLCEGTRHSIENLLLDPLIIVCLIIRNYKEVSDFIGLTHNSETYLDIFDWSESRWQQSVDLILKGVADDDSERCVVKYSNGITLTVPKSILMMCGHDLHNLVREYWHGIFKNNDGDKLLKYVCDILIPEIKKIAPEDMFLTIKKLATAANDKAS